MSALFLLLSLLAPPSTPSWLAAPSFPSRYLGAARPARAPTRVVTVAPSITEIVFALGAGSTVVGVTRFDDQPPEVASIARIGGFLDPSAEQILALRAELVIAAPNASNRVPLERLSELGVPVLVVPGNGFSDLFHAIDAIGVALGREDAALALTLGLRAEIDRLARAPRPRTKVAIVYDRSPLVLAGPGSFGDTILRLLGAENVVKVAAEYPSYSREQLLEDAPELIVDASMMDARTGSVAGALLPVEGERAEFWRRFGTLPAVRDRRVFRVTGSELLRPGPRMVAGMEALAEALAPPR